MSQKIKNQHYIPQCILKRFLNDDMKIFECLIKERKIYPTNIRNSMSMRLMYEHELLPTNTIEKKLSDYEGVLDSLTKKIDHEIEKIEDGREFDTLKELMQNYLPIVLIMYYRSGALFEEFGFETTENKSNVYEMLLKIHDVDYILELSKTIYKHYKFGILKSENGFLISDQYIGTAALRIKNQFSNVSNRQIGLKDVLILIPISSEYYLTYFDSTNEIFIEEDKLNILDSDEESLINDVITNNSYIKVAGHCSNQIANSLDNYESNSPVGMIVKYENGRKEGNTLKKEVFAFEKDKLDWQFFRENKWRNMKKTHRNDMCPCGSRLKFKKCCYIRYQTAKRLLVDIHYNEGKHSYTVSNYCVVEKSISEFKLDTNLHSSLKNLLDQLKF